MRAGTRRRRGLSTLQAVLLLGAGFLVVWGLMDVWRESQQPIQTEVAKTLRGEIGSIAPGRGEGRTTPGGPAAGGAGDPRVVRISHEPKPKPKPSGGAKPLPGGAGTTPLNTEQLLDALQAGLDVVGLFPVLGEPADLLSALVSYIRGDTTGALLSLGSTLPIAGWGTAVVKWARKLPLDQLLKHTDEMAAALKRAEAARDVKQAERLREQLAALQNEQARRGLTPRGGGKMIPPRNPPGLAGGKYLDAADFAKLPRTGTIDPKQVRFSQDSIAANFKEGGAVEDLVKGIKSGKVDPNSIPAIRIVEKDGKIYTLDNRRLYVFQQAGVPIRFEKLDSIPKREGFKFTTNNEGTDILVRKATE